MEHVSEVEARPRGVLEWLATNVGRILFSVLIPGITFWLLIQGFKFLRANEAPKGVITVVAIIWGVGGVAALYLVFNWLVEQGPEVFRKYAGKWIAVRNGRVVGVGETATEAAEKAREQVDDGKFILEAVDSEADVIYAGL